MQRLEQAASQKSGLTQEPPAIHYANRIVSDHTETFMDAKQKYKSTTNSHNEKRYGLGRFGQIVAGVFLVAGGIALLPLPGPGWVTVIVGLDLIKPNSRLVQWLRRKIPGIPEDGKMSKKHLVVGGVCFVLFTLLSTTISIRYGDQVTSWFIDLF